MLKACTKKVRFIIVAVLALFILGGCIGESSTTPIDALASTWVDPETGVNYIFYKDGYGGGLSVRYRSDGSIYVSKE